MICRDGPRMAALHARLTFFAPDIAVLEFPAWDCLPYDRVSPHAGVVAQRHDGAVAARPLKGRERPAVLLTTVNARAAAGAAEGLSRPAGAVGRARQ